MRPRRFPLRLPFACLVAASLCAASGTADAQSTAQVAQGPLTQGWPRPDLSLGPLYGVPGGEHELTLPDGSVVLPLPTVSGDPRFQVYLPPPLSGHPTRVERFQIQVPLSAILPPFEPRPVMIGFHFFSVSEQAVFNQDLPNLCSTEGWWLIAPLGLSAVNFGNVESQDSLDAVLDWVEQFVDLDDERMYTVGFSMGGLNALSYAIRHQDPNGRRIAGAASLLGTVDPVYAYDVGPEATKMILELEEVFGGSPTDEPFEYDRVATASLTPSATVDPQKANVQNLLDARIYLGINVSDPTTDLLDQNQALASYVQSQGLDAWVDSFVGPPSHAWTNFDHTNVIAFFQGQTAPGAVPENGPPMTLHADREDAYRFTEVREIEPETVARYRITVGAVGSNSFMVQETTGLHRLYLDPSAIGISTAANVTLSTYGKNPSDPGVTFVLAGFATPPKSVTVDGLPPVSWSHDPATGELTVQPTPTASFSVTMIQP